MSCNKNNSLTYLNKLNRELFEKIKSKYSKYRPEYIDSKEKEQYFDPLEGEYSAIFVGEEGCSDMISIQKHSDTNIGVILISPDGYILSFDDKEIDKSYHNIDNEVELFKKIDSMIKVSENPDSAPKHRLVD